MPLRSRSGPALAAPPPPPHDGARPRDVVFIVFYDGSCGTCHRSVKFLVARDRVHAFDYAPLHGETFRAAIPAPQRESIPDSIVVLAADGHLLMRSAAVAALLARLPFPWPIVSAMLRLLPRALADRAYDAFARRRSLFAKAPAAACPLVAPELRARFLP